MTSIKLARARERYKPPTGVRPGSVTTLFTFLRLSSRKARRDSLPILSAALAFITVLSLVPLLASLSHFSAGFFADRQTELVDLLASVLPYTEASINEQLRLFMSHTASLRGFGLVAFLLTALTAFGTIEHTINAIWDVPRRRSLRSRLSSFIMLIAWGPLLIGATYSGLYILRQQPAFETIASFVPLHLITFAVTVLGLTMLNWQVPYTHVDFRHALIGGSTSALLLEGLRAGFGYYAGQFPQMSLVYGSFGFALLFMVSIQLAWLIVLIGSEVTYCVQNFSAMSRPRRGVETAEGSWLALAALTLLTERLRQHKPITPHEHLAGRLGVSPEQLRRLLEPVAEAKLLQEIHGEVDGYVLACDPHTAAVGDVLDLYETEQWRVLEDLPGAGRGTLENLRARLAEARTKASKKLTLADLVPTEPAPKPPQPRTAPRAEPEPTTEEADPAEPPAAGEA